MKVNKTAAPAPKAKCNCNVCTIVRRNADLARNYERYMAGELVSKSDKE